MSQRADVLIFKCHYQKWRLDWIFAGRGWKTPLDVMVIPHGSRADKRWGVDEIPKLRQEIGLNHLSHIGKHMVGLVGWIQSNKRWDILTSMWEGIASEIKDRTGEHWDLLAAGTVRDPDHLEDFQKYRTDIEILEKKGLAHYYEFIPRGDIYYKIMALCDFIVLPSTDETQSGTLARIIALNKPFITTAPMEGLTAQTWKAEQVSFFHDQEGLSAESDPAGMAIRISDSSWAKSEIVSGEFVSWEVVSSQYDQAMNWPAKRKGRLARIELPLEF